MLAALALCIATPPHSAANRYVGQTIALYNVAQERFMRMAPSGHTQNTWFDGATCTDMDKSPERPDATLPEKWVWEQFKLVDGGNGTFAFWNAYHRRFVRMPPALGHLDVSIVSQNGHLPDAWGWERFNLVEANDEPGEFGLWHPGHERFVVMSTDADYLESSQKRILQKGGVDRVPKSWAGERFRIVVVSNPPADPASLVPAAPVDPTCPMFTPPVQAVVVSLGVTTLCAIVVAIAAVCCALQAKREAKASIAAPMQMTMVEPIAARVAGLLNEVERRDAQL